MEPRQSRAMCATSGSSALRTAVPERGTASTTTALTAASWRRVVMPAQAQVIVGHVGHHGHVVAVVAQALAQDAAARDLEDGRVHRRVLQHHLGRPRARHVALLDHAAVDDDAVGRGHADPPAHQLQDVADHAHGGRLAVGAGHGHDRDARRVAGREQQVEHGLGHVLRIAVRRMGVHPEARRGVDLDDGPALLAHRARRCRAR